MVAGVRGGCPGSGGGGLDGLQGSGWAVPGGFLGERWASGRCGGDLEACGWRWGARAGRGMG